MTLLVLAVLNLLAPLVVLGVVLKFLLSPRRGLLRDLPAELGERLGRLPAPALARLAGRPVLWVHAASAGEVAAVAEILRRLKSRPAAPALLLTTTTASGRDAAMRLGLADIAALAPLDCWPAVRRFLRQARPYALILVETELWPNMIELSARAGLRVGLVNGRVSGRSFPRYQLVAPFLRPFLARLDRVAVRTELDSLRLASLGVPLERLLTAGNMKYDRLAPGDDRGREELARLGWKGSRVLTAASTHPGEEETLLEAFAALRGRFADLKLVLAPRHVERAEAAAETLRAKGLPFCRLGGTPDPQACVLLVNAMGWLPSFFACSAAAFVGGTLVPVGGHNVLEPAVAGIPAVFGPHTEHTREAAQALLACGGGCEVSDSASLQGVLGRFLDSPGAASASGRKALALLNSWRGATQRTLDHLAPVISPPSAAAENPEKS
ncbi:MAG: 3-deoxy-D-manno-octulosonic acid transferase [Elusimicrobia bacterium]|nr:3-deoxy-D-manno-octulosonic acid transferase [Elusimicrobiota bacterium]